jgi:DNA-directed RNA polymerase subunit RPC12/RpoP
MSTAVLCAGCGGTVEVPDNFSRARIRCPECGVMCPVPVGGKPVPPATPAARNVNEARKGNEARNVKAAAVPRCVTCGQPLPAGGASDRCPECEAAAAFMEAPPPRRRRSDIPIDPDADREPTPEPSPVPARVPAAGAALEDEEDGRPYELGPGQEDRLCPNCDRVLRDEDRVVCPACDFDLVRKRPAVRVYPAVERSWVSGLPVAVRWWLLAGVEAVMFGSAVSGSLALGDWSTLVPVAFFCTPFVVFLLGTYFRVDLSRNTKGRVRLVKRWYVFFLAWPERKLGLGDYEGVAAGVVNEGKFWEWVMLLAFLPAGLIPAVLWWYFAIHKDIYFASLTRDHGYPDEPVYRGWSEARMREAEALLRDVAGLKP